MDGTKNNDVRPQMPLGLAKRGFSGVIRHLAVEDSGSALSAVELESRLIEMGFVEGAKVEVLHEGIIGRDPIAVRVENVTIAVRRREAMAIIVSWPKWTSMEAPLMHLALVGTPNSGKTALFNALTGSRQKVANYPGVTGEPQERSVVTPPRR